MQKVKSSKKRNSNFMLSTFQVTEPFNEENNYSFLDKSIY